MDLLAYLGMCFPLHVSTIDIVYNDCHQIVLEVSSRLGVSPLVLVTSDIPIRLGRWNMRMMRIFMRITCDIPVGLGEDEKDYVLE